MTLLTIDLQVGGHARIVRLFVVRRKMKWIYFLRNWRRRTFSETGSALCNA
jgi:hypothetical protein